MSRWLRDISYLQHKFTFKNSIFKFHEKFRAPHFDFEMCRNTFWWISNFQISYSIKRLLKLIFQPVTGFIPYESYLRLYRGEPRLNGAMLSRRFTAVINLQKLELMQAIWLFKMFLSICFDLLHRISMKFYF